jgi:hypothetical protein
LLLFLLSACFSFVRYKRFINKGDGKPRRLNGELKKVSKYNVKNKSVSAPSLMRGKKHSKAYLCNLCIYVQSGITGMNREMEGCME